jgi:hypothetical protein
MHLTLCSCGKPCSAGPVAASIVHALLRSCLCMRWGHQPMLLLLQGWHQKVIIASCLLEATESVCQQLHTPSCGQLQANTRYARSFTSPSERPVSSWGSCSCGAVTFWPAASEVLLELTLLCALLPSVTVLHRTYMSYMKTSEVSAPAVAGGKCSSLRGVCSCLGHRLLKKSHQHGRMGSSSTWIARQPMPRTCRAC